MPSPIPARVPYTLPTVPAVYSGLWWRTQIAKLTQSITPQTTRTVVADTRPTTQDDLIVCDTSGGDISVTLEAAVQQQFLRVTIVNTGAGTVTVVGTVSGVASPTLTQYQAITIQSDGSEWLKIGSV